MSIEEYSEGAAKWLVPESPLDGVLSARDVGLLARLGIVTLEQLWEQDPKILASKRGMSDKSVERYRSCTAAMMARITATVQEDPNFLDDEEDDEDDEEDEEDERNDPTPAEIKKITKNIREKWDSRDPRNRTGRVPYDYRLYRYSVRRRR